MSGPLEGQESEELVRFRQEWLLEAKQRLHPPSGPSDTPPVPVITQQADLAPVTASPTRSPTRRKRLSISTSESVDISGLSISGRLDGPQRKALINALGLYELAYSNLKR